MDFELKRLEHLFFNQNSVQYQFIRKDLVTSILYDGQCSQKQNDNCSKTLCLAVEYVKNCQSGVLFVTLGCLDGQILVQKFTKFNPVCLTICTCSDVLRFAAVVQSRVKLLPS